MNRKQVIIRPETELDIKDAYQWYESQRKGLGDNFLLCTEEALSRASRNPATYSVIYKNVHRVLIRQFPFGIFFIEYQNNIIEHRNNISVLAVLHARRSPKTWKARTYG